MGTARSIMVDVGSVLALKFNGGVMVAADTLGNYGGTAKIHAIDRIFAVSEDTIVGAGGDLADIQNTMQTIDELMVEEYCTDDGNKMSPASLHSYLTRIMHHRRTKMNPIFVNLVLAGRKNGESFLGAVDPWGCNWTGDFICTGFGANLALPLIRKAYEDNPNMTEAEAKALLESCLKVLYYRDCRASKRVVFSTVTDAGTNVSEPVVLTTDWQVALQGTHISASDW